MVYETQMMKIIVIRVKVAWRCPPSALPKLVTSQLIPPKAYPIKPPSPAIIVKVLKPLAWSSAKKKKHIPVYCSTSEWTKMRIRYKYYETCLVSLHREDKLEPDFDKHQHQSLKEPCQGSWRIYPSNVKWVLKSLHLKYDLIDWLSFDARLASTFG